MTIHFGKRNLGAGTRAAPGDTLYIPFAFYNDSGASIFDTGMRVGDIEVFKNGHPTARASDSGYFLGDTGTGLYVGGAVPTQPADTGNYTPFQGLYRCGIRLFNNTQDTGFYDEGSMYHVAITGVSVKSGQTVAKINAFIATFEIEGVRGGTGGAQALPMQRIDTGITTKAVASVAGAVGSVTGAVGTVNAIAANAITATAIAANAIGASELAADAATEIAVATAALDTGLRALITRADTGSRNAIAELDTGATGSLNRIIAKLDTGLATKTVAAVSGAVGSVTGAVGSVTGAVGSVTGAVGSVTLVSPNAIDSGALTGNLAGLGSHDTGIRHILAEIDTGTTINLNRILAKLDTGISEAILAKLDSGVPASIAAGAVASVTGAVGSVTGAVGSVTLVSPNAIDTGALTAGLASLGSMDTGVRQLIARMDTGIANHVAELDTGVTGSLNRILAKLDTGVAENVWAYSVSTDAADTGSCAYAQGRLMAVKGDTGAAHVDGGRLGVSAPAAALDTGATSDAVWGKRTPGDSTKALTTASPIDTGIAATVWGTEARRVVAHRMVDEYDTGRFQAEASATLDTGAVNQAVWGADASRVLTGFPHDTGIWASNAARALTVAHDTGVLLQIARSDTGIHDAINNVDTGVSATNNRIVAKLDTGLATKTIAAVSGAVGSVTGAVGSVTGAVGSVTLVSPNAIDSGALTGAIAGLGSHDTGLRQLVARFDTGINDRVANVDTGMTASLNRILAKIDTGISEAILAKLDSGVPASVWDESGSAFTDTGSLGYKLDLIDTGIRSKLADVDTGTTTALTRILAKLDTGLATKTVAAVSGAVGSVTGAVGSVAGNVDGSVASVTLVSPNAIDSGALTGGLAGLGSHDTGLRQLVARADTGIRDAVDNVDTGTTVALTRILAKLDTGVVAIADLAPILNKLDTGVPASVWDESGSAFTDTGSLGYKLDLIDTGIRSKLDDIDTGTTTALTRVLAKLDTGVSLQDTGLYQLINRMDTGISGTTDRIDAKVDTGVVHDVWAAASRSLTAFAHDTGVADTVWKASLSAYTDTGSAGYKLDLADTGIRSKLDDIDTGTTINLNRLLAKVDTGVVANILDTGLRQDLARVDTGIRNAIAELDTGATGSLNRILAKLDTGISEAIIAKLDTGVPSSVWDVSKSAHIADTGSVAYALGNVQQILGDTGTVHTAGGVLGVQLITNSVDAVAVATAALDTGLRQLIARFDTGVQETVDRHDADTGLRQLIARSDTGIRHEQERIKAKIDTGVVATATVDTGIMNQAVWQTDAARTLTSMDFDTGIRNALADHDTGVEDALDRILAKIDTGVEAAAPDLSGVYAKLDTGVPGSITSGPGAYLADQPLGPTLDTGLPSNVWAFVAESGRTLTTFAFPVDTGPTQAIDRMDTGVHSDLHRIVAKLDSGVDIDVTKIGGDTGAAANLKQAFLDTGTIGVNIKEVNDVVVQGTGDTGTNDPWRPT